MKYFSGLKIFFSNFLVYFLNFKKKFNPFNIYGNSFILNNIDPDFNHYNEFLKINFCSFYTVNKLFLKEYPFKNIFNIVNFNIRRVFLKK